MAERTSLARPYAHAAFDVARDHDELAAWSEMFALACVIAADDQVAPLLDHPAVEEAELPELFADIAGDRFNRHFVNFLKVLAENRRLPMLEEIAALYEDLRARSEARLPVRVVSAHELDQKERTELADALAKRFGKDIEIEVEIDPELLGGAVIHAGDTVIDGSVRGRLQRLGNALRH